MPNTRWPNCSIPDVFLCKILSKVMSFDLLNREKAFKLKVLFVNINSLCLTNSCEDESDTRSCATHHAVTQIAAGFVPPTNASTTPNSNLCY